MYVGLQTKFNFAWVCLSFSCSFSWTALPAYHLSSNSLTHDHQGLIKSPLRADQQEGVRLLSEIFRTSPERRRECLYYLALGNYKLGSYAEARRYNELLLDLEPDNLQAASLRELVDAKVQREGIMGVAIVGGLVAAVGIAGSLLVRAGKKK
jgi:fission 1 protein